MAKAKGLADIDWWSWWSPPSFLSSNNNPQFIFFFLLPFFIFFSLRSIWIQREKQKQNFVSVREKKKHHLYLFFFFRELFSWPVFFRSFRCWKWVFFPQVWFSYLLMEKENKKVDAAALEGFSPVSTTRIFWNSRKRSGIFSYFVFTYFPPRSLFSLLIWSLFSA